MFYSVIMYVWDKLVVLMCYYITSLLYSVIQV